MVLINCLPGRASLYVQREAVFFMLPAYDCDTVTPDVTSPGMASAIVRLRKQTFIYV